MALEAASDALGVQLTADTPPALLRNAPGLASLRARRLNRRIADHNRSQARRLDREEMRNILLVNDYRESLGLCRLEADPRLVRAARAHSREMVELGYFSHTSPKKENKEFSDRIRKAGYDRPGGENIAMGSTSGAKTFEQWFSSPGHHRNMVRERFTAIGVGRWTNHWTQNFGTGARSVE